MTLGMAFTLLAFGIGIICVILVIHPEYEDGLFGRLALGGLALAEFSIFWDSFVDERDYSGILNTTFAIQLFAFVFMARHLYRFLRWHNIGEGDWRQAKK